MKSAVTVGRLTIICLSLTIAGCGQDKLDQCFDQQAKLWNPKKEDNSYKGNEAYWNAVASCEDKHRR